MDSQEYKRSILICLILVMLSIYLIYSYNFESEEIIKTKVVSTKFDCEAVNEKNPDNCVHKVFTINETGRREILENTPIFFRNKKDIETIRKVKPGYTYLFHVVGYRSFTLKTFRNILDMKQVNEANFINTEGALSD